MKNCSIQWALSVETYGGRRFIVWLDENWYHSKKGSEVRLYATRKEAREGKKFFRHCFKVIRVEKVQVTIETIQ